MALLLLCVLFVQVATFLSQLYLWWVASRDLDELHEKLDQVAWSVQRPPRLVPTHRTLGPRWTIQDDDRTAEMIRTDWVER